MSNWLDAYISALDTRDSREKANEETINAYTRLADHSSAVHKAGQARSQSPNPPSASSSPVPAKAGISPSLVASPKIRGSPSRASAPSNNDPGSSTSPDVISLRADLTQAQRSRSSLASELAALRTQFDTLGVQKQQVDNSLSAMQAQKTVLERKLRDRDSELKEKRKMIEQVQDEMISLEMQLNVAEEERTNVKKENEDLVKRLVGEARARAQGRRDGIDDDDDETSRP